MKQYTLGDIASIVGGELRGDADWLIQGVASLSSAQAHDLACIHPAQPPALLSVIRAGAVITNTAFLPYSHTNVLVCDDPLTAMMQCVSLFDDKTRAEPDIDFSARVMANVRMGSHCRIGAYSVVGDGVIIGDDCDIGTNVNIGPGTVIGNRVRINSNAVIHAGCRIGDDVVLDYSCTIGAKPFNPVKTDGHWSVGLSIGVVVIGNDCVIGANSVIDRGGVNDTFIGNGVVVDNLVQIGHDAVIGDHTSIAGCAAIGAFTRVGRHCNIGGGSCIAACLEIADDVTVSGMSTVTKTLKHADIYTSGTTVSTHQQWRKNAGRFHRLDQYINRLKLLEKRVL